MFFVLGMVIAGSLQRSTASAQIHRLARSISPRECEEDATPCDLYCPSKYSVEVSGTKVTFTSLVKPEETIFACECYSASGTLRKEGKMLTGHFADSPGDKFRMIATTDDKGAPIIEARYRSICKAHYTVTSGVFLSVHAAEEYEL